MTASELHEENIVAVEKAAVKRNPGKWGLSPFDLQKFEDDVIYFHVPDGCGSDTVSKEEQVNQRRAE